MHTRSGGTFDVLIVGHPAPARSEAPEGTRVMPARGMDEAARLLGVFRFDAVLVAPSAGKNARVWLEPLASGAVMRALDVPSEWHALVASLAASTPRPPSGIAHYFNELFALELDYGRRPERATALSALDRDHLAHAMAAGRAAGPRAPREGIDVDATVRELAPVLRNLLGPRIVLVHDLGAGAALVPVDPLELEHALLSLALDARDALRAAGRVTVGTRLAGPQLVLTVSGEGPGQTPHVERRRLDPLAVAPTAPRGRLAAHH